MVTLVPPAAADKVALTVAATGDVVIANVAVSEPSATVTLVGTDAFPLLEDKLTATPPEGAAPVNVTVPVADVPPTTDEGDTVIVEGTAGVTDRTAVRDWLP